MASIRLPASTSSTSLIERSCPTASGVRVSGKVTISRRDRIGSASGSGSAERIALSGSAVSTTSRVAASGSAPKAPPRPLPSLSMPISLAVDRHPARRLGLLAQRQLDAQHSVLVGGGGALGVDVDLQL